MRMLRNWGAVAATMPLLLAGQACAEDAKLGEICELLLPIRSQAEPNIDMRGATPAFRAVKERLRDWVQSRLARVPPSSDFDQLARQLDDEVSEMTAACNRRLPSRSAAPKDDPMSDTTALGTIGRIELKIAGRNDLMSLKTSIGITCGDDQSAYVFAWDDGKWRRIWQFEQNVGEGNYEPMTISMLQVEPFYVREKSGAFTSRESSDRLVMIAGFQTWCTSNWHQVYYKLWRLVSQGNNADPLIDGTDFAFEPNEDMEARLDNNAAHVEFRIRSIDSGVHNRAAIRHFRIEQRGAVRTPPIAYKARDFVDEWLTQPWLESRAWGAADVGNLLEKWHADFHAKMPEIISGSFIEPSQHCRDPADAWQVAIDFGEHQTENGPPVDPAYFLVRWRPPYRMTLLAIAAQPWPTCDEPDPEAD